MKYIKKPIPVDAIQWTGDNFDEVASFMIGHLPIVTTDKELIISTLEGKMHVGIGYYIVRGIDGEYYGCRQDIFERTYRAVATDAITCRSCEKKFPTRLSNIFYDALAKKYKYWAICPYCGIKMDWEEQSDVL